VEFHTANISDLFEIKNPNSDKYRMRTIKLYENFGQERIAFSDKIGGTGTQVDLYDEPMDMKYATVRSGVVNWDMELTPRKWGMELGETPASITSMRLEYEVDDEETGDAIEKEIEIGEGTFSHDQFTTEINEFPLNLEAIEIKMNHTTDPRFWKIRLYLGKSE
jgi:hypothetical protein